MNFEQKMSFEKQSLMMNVLNMPSKLPIYIVYSKQGILDQEIKDETCGLELSLFCNYCVFTCRIG